MDTAKVAEPGRHPSGGDHGLRQPAGRRRAQAARSTAAPARDPDDGGTGSEATTVGDPRHPRPEDQERHLAPLPAPAPGDRRSRADARARAEVTSSCGLDVVCHAVESYISKPFDHARAPSRPTTARPTRAPTRSPTCGRRRRSSTAGATCGGRWRRRRPRGARRDDARRHLAGIGFGSAACTSRTRAPIRSRRSSTSTSRRAIRDDHPFVPHGWSVIVTAPAAFRFTYEADPEKHRRAAELIAGASCPTRTRHAPRDADRAHARRRRPSGVRELGYGEDDVDALVEGAIKQQRLLVDRAPRGLRGRPGRDHRRVDGELVGGAAGARLARAVTSCRRARARGGRRTGPSVPPGARGLRARLDGPVQRRGTDRGPAGGRRRSRGVLRACARPRGRRGRPAGRQHRPRRRRGAARRRGRGRASRASTPRAGRRGWSGRSRAGAGVTLERAAAATRGRAGLAFGVDHGARTAPRSAAWWPRTRAASHVVRHGAMRGQVRRRRGGARRRHACARLRRLVKDNTGYDLPGLLVRQRGHARRRHRARGCGSCRRAERARRRAARRSPTPPTRSTRCGAARPRASLDGRRAVPRRRASSWSATHWRIALAVRRARTPSPAASSAPARTDPDRRARRGASTALDGVRRRRGRRPTAARPRALWR